MISPLWAAALDYAAQGLHVLPLRPGRKEPLLKGWETAASCDPAQVGVWWGRCPNANIGIHTGLSGLVVADLDGTTGAGAWRSLLARHGGTAEGGWIVTTPGDGGAKPPGRHVYFAADPDRPMKPSVGKLGPNIDLRAGRSYVVAPPSIHPAGKYKAKNPFDRTTLPMAPAWLSGEPDSTATTLLPPPAQPVRPVRLARSKAAGYFDSALHDETGKVAAAEEGTRNDALYVAALKLGALLGAGLGDDATAAEALTEAGQSAGLTTAEVAATIRSGLSAGRENPRVFEWVEDAPPVWLSPITTTTEPIDGAELLDDVRRYVARFVAFPTPAALDAVTLWAAHAHLVTASDNSPRLALLSPEPGSGKTRTLEILDLLVPRPMHALNASVAPIFRSIEAERPTLLFDEVDAIFGRHGKDDPAEDLRGLLNAGHRKGATVPRCVGKDFEVKRFPVYAAVALAGLGDLPDTVMSRSIIVRMRRRAPAERIEPFRRRVHGTDGEDLRERLIGWAETVSVQVGDAWPDMPGGVVDRPADVWEPLLAIADAAGGHWPDTARAACVSLVAVAANREASLGVRLLGDLREIFGTKDALTTEVILHELLSLDEAPWADLRGKPLDARGLARRLRQYEVGSVKVKVAGKSLQGYRREHLWDAWTRYLDTFPGEGEPTEPAEPRRSEVMAEVPFAGEVPEPVPRTEPHAPPLTWGVPQVPQVPLQGGSVRHSRDTRS